MIRHTLLMFLAGLVAASLSLVAVRASAGPPPTADAGSHASTIAGPWTGPGPAADTKSSASPVEPTDEPVEVHSLLRHGSYLGAAILGVFGLVALLLRLGRGSSREKQRERALYATAAVTTLSVVADLVANGQAPNTGMLVSAGAVFVALVLRSPLPPRRPTSGPPVTFDDVLKQGREVTVTKIAERGSVVGVLLVMLVVGGCAGAGRGAKTARSVVVDCSVAVAAAGAPATIDKLEQVIRDATAPGGSVDWVEIRAAMVALGLADAKCLLAAAVERLLTTASRFAAAPSPNPMELRAGFAEMSRERWDGARCALPSGQVL